MNASHQWNHDPRDLSSARIAPEQGKLRRSVMSRRTHGHAVRWVHDVLRHELQSGAFPDQVLPSEDALIKRYDVSRGTIRRVMELLREEGLIERLRGAGTFSLSPIMLNHGLSVSRDLAQDVNQDGTRATIFATHVERHPATDFIAEKLGLAAGDEVLIVETSTYLDGFRFSCRSAFMPIGIFGGVDPQGLDFNRSPYTLLEELLEERPGDTCLNINAAVADESVAELLGISPGSPTLDSNRVIFSLAGEPIEYSISRARADRLTFTATMDAIVAQNASRH